MTRPDPDAILAPLKPFQRRTVDHAFHRLFEAGDSTSRFLVADEVGLGKTLVARGVIARAIDLLWDDVERIDIIYICSNVSIARANREKLRVSAGEEQSVALSTRLTMLATDLAPKKGRASLTESRLNFVSFTPATSFDMGNSSGQAKERAVLFRLLAPLVSRRIPLMNLLQGGVTRTDRWRRTLEESERNIPLEPGIQQRFVAEYGRRRDVSNELETLLDEWFARHRKHWPEEARQRRNGLIGELRHLLAGICVDALEPDLVILDEFQRFKSLLENNAENSDPAAELAHALFRARTPEGHPVRTLLLSATPYKLYTADAEIEHEDHYADFLATTRFLMAEDEARVANLKSQIGTYSAALKHAAFGDASGVVPAKVALQETLLAVMTRTERVGATASFDAMVEEAGVALGLLHQDVRQYLAADALFRAVGDQDPITYWKSAPYLLHFMRNYRFNERLEETIELSSSKLNRVLQDHASSFLQARDLEAWAPLESANAKLRVLARDLLDGGLWRLLWMPPTVPYWPLEGPFEGQEGRTKTLLFSAWNVVPEVVSGVLSYEAERRMMDGQLESYQNPAGQQSPRLRLTHSTGGNRSRHRLFLLLLPCLPLADLAHPLEAPSGMDRRGWVRERVKTFLSSPELPDPAEGPVDERWEWAAPLLLDPGLRGFLEAWLDDGDLPRPNPEVFPDYVEDLCSLDASTLGRRPDHLEELLTEVALGSPAVLAARTLRGAGLQDNARRSGGVRLAEAFWSLFNRPAVISLLDQLARSEPDTSREESYYWRQVLRYCIAGNLQSVLDEAWHLMWEQQAWSDTADSGALAEACVKDLAERAQPPVSRVHANFYSTSDDGAVVRDELRIRTTFALRFGDTRTEDGHFTQDRVREAFNSPFRPFVLASTSVGQEGLDFHPWCHRLVHWDLPGNPVDLEQREGRVHRYKGHAVRRNVAAAHHAEALHRWRPGDDPWRLIFELAHQAARAAGASDLVPHWLAAGPWRVQRHVPLLPYSKEVEVFRRLKRQLAAYRVVFGQPRQEELLTLLENADLETALLREWAVDLRPRGDVN